jgi:hypothetical protein
MRLQGPTQIKVGEKPHIKPIITYEGMGNPQQAEDITFHTHALTRYPSWGWLQRLRGTKWEVCQSNSNPGFMIVDDPDVPVNVGKSDFFASLRQGEEWTTEETLDQEEFPGDTAIGDKFRFWYRGLELGWWDWGVKDSHIETRVMLPCYLHGDVVEPKDTGRPKIIIPATNFVEFTAVE